MTALPPCVCRHAHQLHVPGGGSCTAGCDCRGYVRRTTLPDEHMQPQVGSVASLQRSELGAITVDGARQYRVLIASTVSGPYRAQVDDDLGTDGKATCAEVVVSVSVELYCERCDLSIAVLEPQEIEAADLVSVLVAHGPACVAAPSWDPARDG